MSTDNMRDDGDENEQGGDVILERMAEQGIPFALPDNQVTAPAGGDEQDGAELQFWRDITLLRIKSQLEEIVRSAPRTEREDSTDGWLNLKEAALYLGLSERTLRTKVEMGTIRGSKDRNCLNAGRGKSGKWYFKRSDLDGFRRQPKNTTLGREVSIHG